MGEFGSPSFPFSRERKGQRMDTCFNYTGDTAYFSSDERKWHRKIMALAETHPGEVEILRKPEDNDGCIYAKIPSKWLKIRPKSEPKYTDEQIAAYRERMMKLRSEMKEIHGNDERTTT